MKKSLSFAVLLASLGLPASQASIDIVSTRMQTYTPPKDCEKTDTCSLTGAKFIEYKKKITLPGDTEKQAIMMTDTRFVLSAKTVQDIESYGVVQFIHGCNFNSEYDGKTVRKYQSVFNTSFSANKPLSYPVWHVDSDSPDPLYSSLEGEKDRFIGYRWNSDGSLNPDTSAFYGVKKPTRPVVYLTDLPGGASLLDSGDPSIVRARNISLEFQTCLFKMTDIPETTDPLGSNIDRSKALTCFSWSHNYVYNFSTQKYETPKTIDPFCLQGN